MADVNAYFNTARPLLKGGQQADFRYRDPSRDDINYGANRWETDFSRQPHGAWRILDLLNRAQYPVANTLRRLTDPYKNYSAKEYAKGIWDGIWGNERSQTTDTLTNLGWNPYTKGGKFAKAAVGLAGDIVTDPLTWIGLPGLTSAGKAAKAGKLIKVADKAFDLSKIANVNKVRGILENSMKAAGVADDAIKVTMEGLKGIKGADYADKVVNLLNKYGNAAEKVAFAPTWAKQYKAGQRALLHFKVPGIPFVTEGWSTPIRSPFFQKTKPVEGVGNRVSQKIFNAATKLGRKIEAGRVLANKTLYDALPEATKAMKIAGSKSNLFRIGDEYYDLTNHIHNNSVRASLKRQLKALGVSDNELSKFDNFLEKVDPNSTGLADSVEQTFKSLGIEGEKASLKGLRNQKIAKRFGEGWKGVGGLINTFSDAFNVIPERAKMIRRLAQGISKKAGDQATEALQNVWGKDADKILDAGLPPRGYVDIVDESGNVVKQVKESKAKKFIERSLKEKKNYKVKDYYGEVVVGGEKYILRTPEDVRSLRIETTELMAHPAVRSQLDALKKSGNLTLDEAKKAIETLRASTNENTGYGAALRKIIPDEGVAGPLYGWGDETIDRALYTLDNWGDLSNMDKVSRGVYDTANINTAIGHIAPKTRRNFILHNQLSPLLRQLDAEEVEKYLDAGQGVKDMTRSASGMRTHFQARAGKFDPYVRDYLLNNLDNVVTHDINGKPILGRDFLGKSFRESEYYAKKFGKEAQFASQVANRAEALAAQKKTAADEVMATLPGAAAAKKQARFSPRIARATKAKEYWGHYVAQAEERQKALMAAYEATSDHAQQLRDHAALAEKELTKQGNKDRRLIKELNDTRASLKEAEKKLNTLKKGIRENESVLKQYNSELEKATAELANVDAVVDFEEAQRLQNRIDDLRFKISESLKRNEYRRVPKPLLNKKARILSEIEELGDDYAQYADQLREIDNMVEEGRRTPGYFLNPAQKKVKDLRYDAGLLERRTQMPTATNERVIEANYRRANREEEAAQRIFGRANDYDSTIEYGTKNLDKATAKELALTREQELAMKKAYEGGVAKAKAMQDKAEMYARFAKKKRGSAQSFMNMALEAEKDMVKNAINAEPYKFSTEVERLAAMSVKNAANSLRVRGVLQGVADNFEDIPANGAIPWGYVPAKDILPKHLLQQVKLSGETMDEYRRLVGAIGGEDLVKALENKMIPFEMVKPLEYMIKGDVQSSNMLLRGLDWCHGILKPFMLGAPGTQTRNMVSSFLMSWAAGDFRRPEDFYNFARSFLWSWGKSVNPDDVFVYDGKEYKVADIIHEFDIRGGDDNLGEMLGEVLSKNYKASKNWAAKAAEGTTKYANWLQTQWAQRTEKTFRLTHFMNELQKGATFDEAMESVAKAFYDYSDLSQFEKNWMRRIFPFYTFFRKNTEANLRYLAKAPGYVSFPQKLANNANYITEEDKEHIPLSWLNNPRNEWLLNQAALRLPWDKGVKFFPLQNFLPQIDAANLNPKEGIQSLTGMITPVVKTPLELIMNKDFFTGRELQSDAYPKRYFLGMDMNPKLVHALRPFRQFDVADRVIRELTPEASKRHGMAPRNEATDLSEKAWRSTGTFFGTKAYEQDKQRVQQNMIRTLQQRNSDIEWRLKRYPQMDPKRRRELFEMRKQNNLIINEIKRGRDI